MFDKKSQKCEILAFSNYSFGLYANENSHEPNLTMIDYSDVQFSKDSQ
jgi:hypothetical protein